MTVRGDFSKVRKVEQRLRDLPRVVGQKVATAAAEVITDLARKTFDAGENAFGDTWQPGAHGQKVTLRKSGALARFSYVAVGTRLRAQLGPRWARFQVGKRPVFPRSSLPIAYAQALRAKTNEVIQRELAG